MEHKKYDQLKTIIEQIIIKYSYNMVISLITKNKVK